ncbi:hypothetical protein [Yersinia phage vB_YenM_P778]
MGWTSVDNDYKNNKDFYNHRLTGGLVDYARVLDVSFQGNEIWELIEVTHKGPYSVTIEVFINLYVVKRDNGQIFWKNLSESCGPYYYKCPLKFLKASTCQDAVAIDWRGKCLQLKAQVKSKPNFKESLRRGQVITTKAGSKVEFLFHHNRQRYAGRLVSEDKINTNQTFAWKYSEIEDVM